MAAKAERDSVNKAKAAAAKKKKHVRKNGKPIANGEFISWTDVTTRARSR